MKILSTIFLTSIIFVQAFSTYFIKADFYLNQSYIAKNFCVNRDKPMMHCDGKCYLSKKITEQEKKDHSPVSRTERFDGPVFFLPETVHLRNSVSTVVKPKYFIEEENLVSSSPCSIFHPPTA